jgi:hypothetical protein
MTDEWREKYGLISADISLEIHLDEDRIKDRDITIDEVRVIEINETNEEFGFEDDLSNPEMMDITFGFGGIKIRREDFEEALKHYRLRDIAIKELKDKAEEKDADANT